MSEGLVSVRREGNRNNPEIARLCELEDAARNAGKGKWSSNLQVCIKSFRLCASSNTNTYFLNIKNNSKWF